MSAGMRRSSTEDSEPSAITTGQIPKDVGLEFPERDACDIDDERDQGPLFDAPGHPGARYTWGGR